MCKKLKILFKIETLNITFLFILNFLRFVESKFEEIFAKHSHTHPNALTGKELQELLDSNKEANDRKGA